MRRVLVTGMGGELGTRVAQLLEARAEVGEIAGFDIDPPRRRLRRATFARIDPRDRDRVVRFVTDLAPTHIAHFGVYEPHARLSTRDAAEASEACTVHALGAAARAGQLRHVAVRSGLVVYGRGRGAPLVPDESAELAPTTRWGRICLDVEAIAAGVGRRHNVTITSLRYAPVVGSHLSSPFGRVMRLPAVAVPAFSDPPLCLLHPDDSARAMVEALARRHDGPLNILGPGAASPWQMARLGGRIPVPVVGLGWSLAKRVAELAGAPVPDQVLELIKFGRAADGRAALHALGLTGLRSAEEVCADLYEFASVTPLRAAEEVA